MLAVLGHGCPEKDMLQTSQKARTNMDNQEKILATMFWQLEFSKEQHLAFPAHS